ncbi:hypothetical protein YC2023_039679 [Brassica napus]
MAISKKMLHAYVVSIFLIVSSVHCSDRIHEFKQCFPKQPCGKTCEEYCVGHINDKWDIRTSCESGACCCIKDGARISRYNWRKKSLRYKLIARNNLHRVITIEGKVTCRRRMLT